MEKRSDLSRWIYYYGGLPLWGLGIRPSGLSGHMLRLLGSDSAFIETGYRSYCSLTGKSPSDADVAFAVQKAALIKITRESDAYLKLRGAFRRPESYFTFEGLDHLRDALSRQRPVYLLTGHTGSFYTMFPATASLTGRAMHTIARSVDDSPGNPRSRQTFEKMNYRLTEVRDRHRYIYTDYKRPLDRSVVELFGRAGVFFVLLDIPRAHYAPKRVPATLLGFPSSFPAGFLSWGMRHGAVFLTAWSTIDVEARSQPVRTIRFGPLFREDLRLDEIVQTYADSFSSVLSAGPWQWMGLPIIHQYCERNGTSEHA